MPPPPPSLNTPMFAYDSAALDIRSSTSSCLIIAFCTHILPTYMASFIGKINTAIPRRNSQCPAVTDTGEPRPPCGTQGSSPSSPTEYGRQAVAQGGEQWRTAADVTQTHGRRVGSKNSAVRRPRGVVGEGEVGEGRPDNHSDVCCREQTHPHAERPENYTLIE